MKRNQLVVWFLLGLLSCSSCSKITYKPIITSLKNSTIDTEKKDALSKIETFYNEAKYHHLRILECAILVSTSDSNIDLITKVADYVSKFGSDTKVFMSIAKISSTMNKNSNELKDILDLALMKTSEADRIISLAKFASTLTKESEKEELEIKIKNMKATAEYTSVEDALKNRYNY